MQQPHEKKSERKQQDYMEHNERKPQDGLKKNTRKPRSIKKVWAVSAVVMALIAFVTVPVFAWLYIQRSMETMTKINIPYALRLGAGNTRPIQELELSNIDVSGEQKYKDIVFCVYSDQEGREYDLQLAHTGNIGFTYTIYHATRKPDGEISYLGENYSMGAALEGRYLNMSSDNRTATAQYHEKTYGGYNNVQNLAEPLYWKTTTKQILSKDKSAVSKQDKGTYYVDYYVLRISWDKSVQNNKETDMIYIMTR